MKAEEFDKAFDEGGDITPYCHVTLEKSHKKR